MCFFRDAAPRVSTLSCASTHARGKARRLAKNFPLSPPVKCLFAVVFIYVTMIMSVAAVLTRAHVATRLKEKAASAMRHTACCNSGKSRCLMVFCASIMKNSSRIV